MMFNYRYYIKNYLNIVVFCAAFLGFAEFGHAARILVDMDGVIANFDAGILQEYRKEHPDKQFIPLNERTTFYVSEDYGTKFGPEYKNMIEDIQNKKGFFESLPMIEGAKEALNQMIQKGHEVFLVTSPLQKYQNCVLEKYEWVNKNLGEDWVKRIVLTRDKTIVKGDILIDDKPNIDGVENPPFWVHVLFSQPYNLKQNKPRISKWSEWENIVDKVISSKKAVTITQ